MDRAGKGDWGLKILSLLVAVVLWVYVSNEMNPVKEQEFKDLGVDIRGIASNLTVSEVPGNVNLRVQANRDVMSELGPKSIEVFVDLSNVRTGRNLVPVQVRVPSGVKVIDLKPQQVVLNVEPLSEKQIPIKVRSGDPPEKGFKTAALQTRPDAVIVRGPKSVVDRVSFASADVSVRQKKKPFSETVPVSIIDDVGAIVEEKLVRKVPSVVDVFVSIVPDLPSKRVPVIPVISGEPREGYMVTMTVVDPQELQVTATQGVLEKISEISTKPVNISNADKDVYVTTAPELPEGVVANRQSLKVLVRIGKE